MAIDQNQVENIITAASADDPAVKLQNLEREVDLIKVTIKRLLMDIRERMNELENPFTLASSGAPGSRREIINQDTQYKQAALEAREAALDARESTLEVLKIQPDGEPQKEHKAEKTDPVLLSVADNNHNPDNRYPVSGSERSGISGHTISPPQTAGEVLPLQKAYKLFCWTQLGVKKFGHDRLEIVVESYHVMGYISKKTMDEIRQISRIMPENLEAPREIGPDQFVFEIYTLNRILSPEDTSLDRDMIEVITEQRRKEHTIAKVSDSCRGIPGSVREQNNVGSSCFGKNDLAWMNLRA